VPSNLLQLALPASPHLPHWFGLLSPHLVGACAPPPPTPHPHPPSSSYEIDKLTASQRLDLNLEKGRMRDELQMLRDKSNELEIKVACCTASLHT
jgi:hypothetical protein